MHPLALLFLCPAFPYSTVCCLSCSCAEGGNGLSSLGHFTISGTTEAPTGSMEDAWASNKQLVFHKRFPNTLAELSEMLATLNAVGLQYTQWEAGVNYEE